MFCMVVLLSVFGAITEEVMRLILDESLSLIEWVMIRVL